ncbi:Protein bir1 [Meyerozyma sp. JA9]|nr:Protein bir1 [Meyerozyma sp. JA9]
MSYLGMQYQANRLATFENGVREGKNKKRQYWAYEVPDRHHLAEFGFYFTPTKVHNDQITCFCCKKKEKNIEGVENIAQYHLENNPKCAFAYILMAQYNHSIEGSDAFWQSDHAEALREPFSRSAVALRRRTFGKYWHFDNGAPVAATSQALAKAGFFYCPVDQGNDRTQCVYCKFCLEGWSEDDDPIEEHKKYQSDCYLLHCASKLPFKQTTRRMRRPLREGSVPLSDTEGASNATTDGEFSDANFNLAEIQLKVDQASKTQATDEGSAIGNLTASEEPEEDPEPRRKSRRLQEKSLPDTSQEDGQSSLVLSDTDTKLESRVYGSKRKRRRAPSSLSEKNGLHDGSEKDLDSNNKLVRKSGLSDEQTSAKLSSQHSDEDNEEKGPESSTKELEVSESTRNAETSESFEATESSETYSLLSDDSSFEPSTKRRKPAKKSAKKEVSNPKSTSKPQFQKARDPFETSFDETRFNDVLKSPKKASKIKIRSKVSQQPELDIERNLGDYDDNHLNSIEHEVGHIFDGSAIKVERSKPDMPARASKKKPKRNANPDSSVHDISGGIFELEKSFEEHKKRQSEYKLVIDDKLPNTRESQEHKDMDLKTVDMSMDKEAAKETERDASAASPNNALNSKETEEIPSKSTSKYYTSLFSDSSSEASYEKMEAVPMRKDDPPNGHQSDPKDESVIEPTDEPELESDPRSVSRSDPKTDPKSDPYSEKISGEDGKSAQSDKLGTQLVPSSKDVNGEESNVKARSPMSPVSNGHESSKSASEESNALTAPNEHSSATSKNASSASLNAEIQEKNGTSVVPSVNHSLVRSPVEMPNKEERYRSSPILESSLHSLGKSPVKSPQVNPTQIGLRKPMLPESFPQAKFAAQPTPTHISSNKEPGDQPEESPDNRHQEDETLREQIDQFSASFSNVLEASTPQKKAAAGSQSWVSRPLSQLLEVIEKLEGASEYLTNIVSSEYDLHNDFDGRLTSFISSMPEEEEDMTVQEWVKHNASMCRKVAKETCNSLIETYREEFNRALRILESLPTSDSPE